jgi:hypothetical protein
MRCTIDAKKIDLPQDFVPFGNRISGMMAVAVRRVSETLPNAVPRGTGHASHIDRVASGRSRPEAVLRCLLVPMAGLEMYRKRRDRWRECPRPVRHCTNLSIPARVPRSLDTLRRFASDTVSQTFEIARSTASCFRPFRMVLRARRCKAWTCQSARAALLSARL